MNRTAIILVGVSLIVVALGFFSVFLSIITWEVAGIIMGAFLTILSLIMGLLALENKKATMDVNPVKLQKIEKSCEKPNTNGSPLLPDTEEITQVTLNNKFLDEIYQEAYNRAINEYEDVKLYGFSLIVEPFVDFKSKVTLLFNFYSKWSNRILTVFYQDAESDFSIGEPIKKARFDFQKKVFNKLPWQTAPHFLEAMSKSFDVIKPLSQARGTQCCISIIAKRNKWIIIFEDGSNGNEYKFYWDGKGLNESNFEQEII